MHLSSFNQRITGTPDSMKILVHLYIWWLYKIKYTFFYWTIQQWFHETSLYWKLCSGKSISQSPSEPFNFLMFTYIERLAAQLCLILCNDLKSRTQTLFACPINLLGIWSCTNRAVCIKIHSLKIVSELAAAYSLWTIST